MLAWAACGVDPSSGTGLVDPTSFHGFMEMGGVLAFTGVILYRSHGAFVGPRGLCRRRPFEDDDDTAPISSRGALLGFILANVFLYAWLVRVGMSGWVFFGLMGLAYATMLCSGYLVASGGVMFPSYTINPSTVLLRTLGGAAFTPTTLAVTFAVDSMFLTEGFPTPLPQMLHTGKLFHGPGFGDAGSPGWLWGPSP